MKRAKILGAVLFLVGGGCGEPEEVVEIAPIGEAAESVAVPDVAAPAVAVPVPVALPAPLHGGTVLMAGQRPIEVVADQAGAFDAYYLGAPPAAPQDARVTVQVRDAQGQMRPVLLTWSPDEARYTGLLAGAQPMPGPLKLVYVLGDETARATAPTFVLLDPAVRAATTLAHAGAVAPVVVERGARPNIVVQAPSAPPPPQVIVHRPPPPRVIAPPPRPRVVVHRPPPPQPRVIVRRPGPGPAPRVYGRGPGPRRGVVTRGAPPRRGGMGRGGRGGGFGRRGR